MNSPQRKNKRRFKKRKRTARIVCRNGSEYWTTQAQFWQWVRDLKVLKMHHNPLTGRFIRESEERLVVLGNNILDIDKPNHLNEVLHSRRYMRRG